MKSLYFDAGPIISLAMNNLGWILKPLKKIFKGEFYIPERVKEEVVDKPFRIRRFKFRAMQTMKAMEEGTIKVMTNEEIKEKTERLYYLANNSYRARGSFIKIVHHGEMESVAGALVLGSEGVVVDERTMRLLLEDPKALRKLLEHKLHTKVVMNDKNIKEFKKITGGVKLIRSTELMLIAYEKGLLDKYLIKIGNARKNLLDALLWGLRLNGCSISEKEMRQIVKMEGG